MKCDRQLLCWLVIEECGWCKRETGAGVNGIMVWGEGNVSILERTGLTG